MTVWDAESPKPKHNKAPKKSFLRGFVFLIRDAEGVT